MYYALKKKKGQWIVVSIHNSYMAASIAGEMVKKLHIVAKVGDIVSEEDFLSADPETHSVEENTKNILKSIAEKVRAFRGNRTVESVSKGLVRASLWRSLESASKTIRIDTICAIADQLGITPEELISIKPKKLAKRL